MDDLAVLMKSREPLSAIAAVFDVYQKAVGAEMNFEKCCILSFPKEEPISALPPPWNKMKPSSSAIYLGVNISTKGKLEDIWAAPMAKARKVARNISGHDFPLTSRIYLINTFLISLFQYLFRFFLFPVPFFQELSKLIRRSVPNFHPICVCVCCVLCVVCCVLCVVCCVLRVVCCVLCVCVGCELFEYEQNKVCFYFSKTTG